MDGSQGGSEPERFTDLRVAITRELEKLVPVVVNRVFETLTRYADPDKPFVTAPHHVRDAIDHELVKLGEGDVDLDALKEFLAGEGVPADAVDAIVIAGRNRERDYVWARPEAELIRRRLDGELPSLQHGYGSLPYEPGLYIAGEHLPEHVLRHIKGWDRFKKTTGAE